MKSIEELKDVLNGIEAMNAEELKTFIKGFISGFSVFCEMQDSEDCIYEMEKRILELEEENKKLVNKQLAGKYTSIYKARHESKKEY